MGIINITPDSFSQDGYLRGTKKFSDRAVRHALRLIQEGADIIDIGGESSRPGSRPVSLEEEIRRVIPTVRALAKKIKIPISVDTYKPLVARQALDAGASMINNIYGISLDKNLLRMVRDYKAGIVLMHMRGTPQNMQKNIHYKNLISEIIKPLQKSIEKCLDIGMKSDKIIIDPGIGFGKTPEQNLEIIHRLADFQILNQPLLIGPSRKSFIGKVLNKDVAQRMAGTTAAVCASVLNGAHIVRVHDVAPLKDVVRMSDAILNQTLN